MKYTLPEEMTQPSQKVITFLKAFARCYRVMPSVDGEMISAMPS